MITTQYPDWSAWPSERALRRGHAAALHCAELYGQVDGDHHKAWVIDQMVRELLGPTYDGWIRMYEASGEYQWNVGIAP